MDFEDLPTPVQDAAIDLCVKQMLWIVKNKEVWFNARYLYEAVDHNDELFCDRIRAIFIDQMAKVAKNS